MEHNTSVALEYHQDVPAPFVRAKGRGQLAAKLVALAHEHEIPVIEEDELAERLFYLEVGDIIPEPFYRAVAEILVYVGRFGSGESDLKSST